MGRAAVPIQVLVLPAVHSAPRQLHASNVLTVPIKRPLAVNALMVLLEKLAKKILAHVTQYAAGVRVKIDMTEYSAWTTPIATR